MKVSVFVEDDQFMIHMNDGNPKTKASPSDIFEAIGMLQWALHRLLNQVPGAVIDNADQSGKGGDRGHP